MIISKIEKFQKNKMKIYVTNFSESQFEYISSNGYFLFLYTKELYKYKLFLNSEIDDTLFKKILEGHKERTKNKSLGLLERSNKTCKDLKDKLIFSGYNKKIVDDTIEIFNEYGYLDDKIFAELYFDNYKNKKSIKIIKNTLSQKGISHEIIDSIITEDFDESSLTKKILEKKLKGRIWDDLDYKEKSKIKAYLYSKGLKFNNL